MSEKTSTSRRSALKVIGSSIVGLAGVSGTALADEEETVGLEEVGLYDKYTDLLDEYKFDEARNLLSENNVKARTNTATRGSDSSNPEIRPDDYYGKGESTAQFDVVSMDDEDLKYALTLTWSLRNVKFGVDLPTPKDKAALSYRPDGFIYDDDSLRHRGQMKTTEETYKDVTSTVKEPPTGSESGAVVSYDDRFYPEGTKGDGYMQITIKRDRDGTGEGGVGGVFSHAWSTQGATLPGNHGISISAGVISVSTGTFVHNWKLPNQDDRDENL